MSLYSIYSKGGKKMNDTKRLSYEYSKNLEEIKNRIFNIEKVYIKRKSWPIQYVVLIKNYEGFKVKIDTEFRSFSVKKNHESFGETLDDKIITNLLEKINTNKHLLDQKSIDNAYKYRIQQAEEILKLKSEPIKASLK